MKHYDLIIVGGGMVGLALGASLSEQPISIALIEPYPITSFDTTEVTYRVSALNLASEALLNQLGVWQTLQQWRMTPYDKMHIFEQDSFAQLHFDTHQLGISHLGHIVENKLIQQALWQRIIQQHNVTVFVERPLQVSTYAQSAMVTLEEGTVLMAKLVVGADGSHSWLRNHVDIPLVFRDYGHSALVCNVETELSHEHCARQVFSPQGILAFLPLHQPHLQSIVWSLPPQKAKEQAAQTKEQFNRHLTTAFDNRLGACQVVTERRVIPLRARYARDFARHRIVLIGDAAHTIHPLAGLGVNLGFSDVQRLAQILCYHLAHQHDIGELRHLRAFERQAKLEAFKMLIAMQGFRDLFAGSHPLKKLIRGLGVRFFDQLGGLKQEVMLHALGVQTVSLLENSMFTSKN